jgi:hypothetical protein
MDDHRFDNVTRALARGASRRRVLGMLVGGFALALRGSKGVTAQSNSECAALCIELYPPGKQRGECISQGARGEGPCTAVGCISQVVSVFASNDTPVSVGPFSAGDELRITASGTVNFCIQEVAEEQYGDWVVCENDANGFGACTPTACGALVGSFNPNGQLGGTITPDVFVVGTEKTVTVPADGYLYLQVYDQFYDDGDNSGSFSVSVSNCPVSGSL